MRRIKPVGSEAAVVEPGRRLCDVPSPKSLEIAFADVNVFVRHVNCLLCCGVECRYDADPYETLLFGVASVAVVRDQLIIDCLATVGH